MRRTATVPAAAHAQQAAGASHQARLGAANLTVGPANDSFEREADAIADKVLRVPVAGAPAAGAPPPVQAKSDGAGPVAAPSGSTAAPSLVHDVLNSPGQPLDRATRGYFEPRFGADFGHVRIHADGRAAESARAIGALGYTRGPHIGFAAGRYAPDSGDGRRLLAHELAHVVQQGRGETTDLQCKPPPKKEKEPEQPPIPPAPLLYNDRVFASGMPSANETTATTKALVDAKVASGLLTAAKITNAPPGSEMFLWRALWTASSAPRGSEIHMIAPVAWIGDPLKAPTGQPPPVVLGQVIVRVDRAGAGEAEFLGMSVIGPQKVADADAEKAVETASKQLVDTFKLKAVIARDGAKWKPEELAKVAMAFAALPDPDKSALKGMELRRLGTINTKRAAQYNFKVSLAAGNTVVVEDSHIEVGDATFASDSLAFVGSSDATAQPYSVQLLVHEVGHNISERRWRERQVAEKKDFTTYKKSYNAWEKAAPADKAARLAETNKAAEDHGKAAKSEQSAVASPAQVNSAKADQRKAGQAADAARTAAQTAAAALPAADATAGDIYRKAFEAVHKEIGDYLTNIASAQPDATTRDEMLDDALASRDTIRKTLVATTPPNPVPGVYAPAQAAQDAWAMAVRMQGHIPYRTTTLERFVTFVTKERIAPFTEYAQRKWPYAPGEFFSDAYSLWRTDRAFLEKAAPTLLKWFDDGEYRK